MTELLSPHRFSCPVARLLDTLGKRWSLLILHFIASGTASFSGLRAELGAISSRTLSERLQELEHAGFILRMVQESRPVTIRYYLSPRGEDLCRALKDLEAFARTDTLSPSGPLSQAAGSPSPAKREGDGVRVVAVATPPTSMHAAQLGSE